MSAVAFSPSRRIACFPKGFPIPEQRWGLGSAGFSNPTDPTPLGYPELSKHVSRCVAGANS
eukprot:14672079-Alexandrium_andersonii.AAC.1